MHYVPRPQNIPKVLAHLRSLSVDELPVFCQTYRTYLIDEILEHGGHFSANLGTVELTAALHYILNTPIDQLVWDVGHQAYLHKVITGRKDVFSTIRKKEGISGFPKRSESEFDTFGTGHSSTSISAILGMAEADKLTGISRQHVAVIGDGSLTGGMAWEALNNAAVSNTNILVIINDNQMGIDPNAGALNQYLNNINPASNFFTDLGFEYRFTPNGHDVKLLVNQLEELTKLDGPKIWHVKTKKGKGYPEAEAQQTKWHAVKYVKIKEGGTQRKGPKFQDVFGKTLLDLAQLNDKVVGVTPAMPSGCSMNILMKAMPERCFDVGIAEQHAVTFSAGLAANGLIPYCNIYSTFLQRGFDQVVHDVCIQNLPVIFCLDRAGVVGEDGPTHHGLYDISFLRSIPNLTLMAPSNEIELRQMMFNAMAVNGPVAIRYPKTVGLMENWQVDFAPLPYGTIRSHTSGTDAIILNAGALLDSANEATNQLRPKGIDIGVTDMGFIKPLDTAFLDKIFETYSTIITLEEGCKVGGFGSAITEYAAQKDYKGHIEIVGFPDQIIEHATREELLEDYGLDTNGLVNTILRLIQP